MKDAVVFIVFGLFVCLCSAYDTNIDVLVVHQSGPNIP